MSSLKSLDDARRYITKKIIDYELQNDINYDGIGKISIDKFRKLTNDKTISDDLAEQIIDSLYQLSVIAYEMKINQ